MKIVVVGKDGVFTTRALAAIAERHDVVGVVESLPKSFGRGGAPATFLDQINARLRSRDPRENLALAARRLGVPFITIDKRTLGDLAPFLERLRPDVACIASMSQLVPAEALRATPRGFLNMHPSMLPDYRGPNPWYWQYHFQEPTWGVSIIQVDEASDTGDILAQEPVPVAPGTPFGETLGRVATVGARLYVEALDRIAAGKPGRVQRGEACRFYARRTKAGETLVDWSWPIERAWHVLRGGLGWLDEIPRPGGWRRHVAWKAGRFEKTAAEGAAGTLGRDATGFFLNHPEGKIRLAPDWGEAAEAGCLRAAWTALTLLLGRAARRAGAALFR